jgi:hypothetical protein
VREWISGQLAEVDDVTGFRHARALGLVAGEKKEEEGCDMDRGDSWTVDYHGL